MALPYEIFIGLRYLRAAGVPASAVQQPGERVDHDPDTEGLWPTVTHAAIGEVRVDGLRDKDVEDARFSSSDRVAPGIVLVLEGGDLVVIGAGGARVIDHDVHGPLSVAAVHAAHAGFVWLTLQRFGVRDADLEGANLSYASLQGADLTRARLKATDRPTVTLRVRRHSASASSSEVITSRYSGNSATWRYEPMRFTPSSELGPM